MKQLIFLILFVGLVSQIGYSQQNFDERLLSKYSVSEITELQKNNFKEYQFILYCLDNAFYITDLPTKKMNENNGRIKSISIDNVENINFLDLKINLIKDDYQFFAIDGTNKMLVVKSIDHLKKEMKNE